MVKALDEMRLDSAQKNKRGIAFIIASIFIWFGIFFVHCSDLSMREKNLYTWYVVAWLMPIAMLLTRVFKIKFQNKENSINQLGLVITINEMLYYFNCMLGMCSCAGKDVDGNSYDIWWTPVTVWMVV